MRGEALRIAGPGLVWAVHFIAVYALISAACAPRALIPLETMRAMGLVVTVVAVAVAGLGFVLAGRGHPAPGMARAGRWAALISVLAIGANAVPLAFTVSCGG